MNTWERCLKTDKNCRVLLMAIIGVGVWTVCTAAEIEILNLLRGDDQRGRQVFQELKCNSCHKVAGDIELKNTTAAKPGPVLGLKQATYKSRFLAQSIIDPSHAIAPGFKDKENPDQSRMGDFTETITIRQLSDLVAYLKSRDEEV